MFNNIFQKSFRLWDNVDKYGTAWQATYGNIIRRMRTACWINKHVDTHSECLILTAFPRQKWLRERVSFLRYTDIACSVTLQLNSTIQSYKFTLGSVEELGVWT
jgi:hypothetical protein